jgi:hypothetical protein
MTLDPRTHLAEVNAHIAACTRTLAAIPVGCSEPEERRRQRLVVRIEALTAQAARLGGAS